MKRKTTLYFLSFAICASLTIAAIGYRGPVGVNAAYTEEKTISDIVSETVKAAGGAYETDEATYKLLHGKVDGTMTAFETIKGTGDGQAADMVCDSESDQHVGFWRWQVRADNNIDAIVEITLKSDKPLKLNHQAITTAPWATNTSFLVYTKSGDTLTKISEVAVKAEAIPAGYYFPVQPAGLKAGDKVYIVYTAGYLATTDFVPVFSFGTEYYESKRTTELVSETILNNGDGTETDYAKYELLYGKIDGEMKKFAAHEGTGDGGANDIVIDSTAINVGWWKWQVRASAGMDAIFAITAKKDGPVFISNEASLNVPWAANSYIKVVLKSGETVKEISSVAVDNQKTRRKLLYAKSDRKR